MRINFINYNNIIYKIYKISNPNQSTYNRLEVRGEINNYDD